MEKKYELVKEDSIEFDGVTLYRIRALKDFGDVKKGDIGGYIKTEENLSHVGLCWVSDDAKVFNNAQVSGNAYVSGIAWVYGDAKVFGDAWICGNAQIRGNAQISGDAWIRGNARVRGNASVCDNARVCDNTQVFGSAQIFGRAQIFGNAQIFGDAQVSDNARVSGYTKILKDAYVCKSSDCITIGPIGSRDDYTTFYKTKTGDIIVSCGCFNDTIDEFIKKVNNTYKGNETYRKQYLGAIEYIKTILI